MIYDCHIHSTFSTDSKLKIEEAIKKGKELNMGFTITDHIDLDYHTRNKFYFNPKDYFEEYEKYKCENILFGLEIGLSKSYINEINEIYTKYPFDFILGSIHFINGFDLYESKCYENLTREETFDLYFNTMLEAIKLNPDIDSLGHIDYISRTLPFEKENIDVNEFNIYLRKIFKELIKREISLEINTRRFNTLNALSYLYPIYKLYSEVGGRYVTLGSDSHTLESLGYGINSAIKMANEIGLVPVYYKKRKVEIMKI